jgi:hypothetical protein
MRTLQCLETTTTYDSDEVLWNDLVESSNEILNLLANGGVQAEIGRKLHKLPLVFLCDRNAFTVWLELENAVPSEL